MSDLRTVALQALEAYDAHEPLAVVMEDLRAALVEHYCDTHCTWADHAPGCIRAEPELNLNDPAVQKRLAAQWGYVKEEDSDA